MNSQKMDFKLIKCVFLILTVCFLFAGCSGSDATEEIMEVRRYEEAEGKPPLTYQNKNLEFQFNQDTTQFSIKNLHTGQMWYSNPPDAENDQLAQGDAKNALRSTLTVKYTTVNDVSTVNDNYKYSIEGKLYKIEPHKDESGNEIGVEVQYTVGQVERTYVIPLAVPESRMKELTENKVDEAGMKEINNYYQVLSLDKLKAGQDSSSLIAQYPDIEKESIYVVRENLKEHLRAKLEEIFAAAGYTQEDYFEDLERYDISTATDKPAFNITVWYYLDDNDFIVEVPMEEIQYNSKYPIAELSILPYFGAGGLEDEGFVFVPDGNGGLINFNNGKKNQAPFNNNMYGWDYGQNRDAIVEETASSFPLYGISKNGESFVCISEQGSSYAFIEADVSGRLSSYNFGKFTYFMLHKEKLDITGKSDTTVQLFEKELPKEHIKQRYRFLDTGDYVNMAECYREYLMDVYPNSLKKTENPDVPTVVEYLGAVDNVEHVLGFPATKPQALTKYKDAKTMTEELVAGGIDNLTIKYSGWANKSIRNSSMNKVNTISRLGSKNDLKDFVNYTKSNGIDLYLDANFSFVYKDGWFDGFRPNRDAAKRVSRKISKWYTFLFIWYSQWEEKSEVYYFVQPKYTMKSIDNYTKQVAKLGVDNISFADIGYVLGADYNPKKLRSRESVMLEQQDKLMELKDQNKKVMINSDNAYAMPYADHVLGMEVNYSKKNIVDETVPFYSIVFHGLVPYSGSPLNMSQEYEMELLKSIESGTAPYYMFTKEPSLELQVGRFTNYFASDYNLWKDSVIENDQMFEDALNGTYNQFITGHVKIADKVYLTEYENGRKVIVNYNPFDYTYNGKKIEAMGFVTEGGGK